MFSIAIRSKTGSGIEPDLTNSDQVQHSAYSDRTQHLRNNIRH